MANVMLQPMMYFNLRHVPLFYGPYLIFKVSHSITSGNEFNTEFTGTRMPKYALPQPDSLGTYVKANYLEKYKAKILERKNTEGQPENYESILDPEQQKLEREGLLSDQSACEQIVNADYKQFPFVNVDKKIVTFEDLKVLINDTLGPTNNQNDRNLKIALFTIALTRPLNQSESSGTIEPLNNNYFEINAVNKNYFSTKYIGGEFKFKATPYEQIYRTGYFKPWPKTGLQGNWLPLSNEIIELGQLYWFLSDVNEALALQNYYTLPETPTVKAGIKYVFNIESVFEIHSYDDDINNQINNGNCDSIFSWQILMDGVEVYAHRPSFAYNDVYKREIEDILTGANITFSIDKEISFENSGELEFRLLIPIHNWNNDKLF
jgi:hypothetical protein